MRFCYIGLLVAVALLSGNNGVAANTAADSQLEVARSLTEQNDVNVDINRLLKTIDTELEEDDDEEDEEERAVSGASLSKIKKAVWKIKITSWFKSNKTPTQVNKILLEKGGKVDWALATAYASYFRNMKYGPFAVEMYDDVNDRTA